MKEDIYRYNETELEFWSNELYNSYHDVSYFVENHVVIDNNFIKLKSYQKEIIDEFKDNKRYVINASRRLGKTMLSIILVLHEAIFNKDKFIAILGFEEMIPHIYELYNYLPHWLIPEIECYSKDFIEFSNGTYIRQFNYDNMDRMRGYQINFLCMDNYSYVINRHSNNFCKLIFPVVSSSKHAKILITGDNDMNCNNHYNKISSFEEERYKTKWLLDISTKNR